MSQIELKLPEYDCHQRVKAGQIFDIQPVDADRYHAWRLSLLVPDHPAALVEVAREWHEIFNPKVGDWYITIGDGSVSCLSDKVFSGAFSLAPAPRAITAQDFLGRSPWTKEEVAALKAQPCAGNVDTKTTFPGVDMDAAHKEKTA